MKHIAPYDKANTRKHLKVSLQEAVEACKVVRRRASHILLQSAHRRRWDYEAYELAALYPPPQSMLLVLIHFGGWVNPSAIVPLEMLDKLKKKKSNELKEIRTRDLPACTIVHQPTTLLQTHHIKYSFVYLRRNLTYARSEYIYTQRWVACENAIALLDMALKRSRYSSFGFETAIKWFEVNFDSSPLPPIKYKTQLNTTGIPRGCCHTENVDLLVLWAARHI
jgi:hypothetical protein